MAKLEAGGKLPPFRYNTPFLKDVSIEDTVKRVQGKTALVFLRYFGCRLCQYDMHLFAQNYDAIRETGGQLLVVLQSDPDELKMQTTPDDPPYEIVCDRDQQLYKAFEIGSAASKDTLGDAETAKKMAVIEQLGLKHGKYEGNELQLPAVFIVSPEMRLTYVHYGTSAGDVPSPEQLTALLK